MVLHHIGYIVESIEKGVQDNLPLSESLDSSEVFTIEEQKVKVCFVDIGKNVFLELVEPLEGNRSLTKMAKKGHAFYHLGFEVNEIELEIERLEKENYRKVSIFSSPAFGGRRCAFLLNPDMQLIELIER